MHGAEVWALDTLAVSVAFAFVCIGLSVLTAAFALVKDIIKW